mmetsp:Transcript_26609/g.67643  ORF Transcript_26609/g.67643 Transcript_26609/m.67643 type:complete len:241 (-) Transcript_26609:1425-2147(-)
MEPFVVSTITSGVLLVPLGQEVYSVVLGAMSPAQMPSQKDEPNWVACEIVAAPRMPKATLHFPSALAYVIHTDRDTVPRSRSSSVICLPRGFAFFSSCSASMRPAFFVPGVGGCCDGGATMAAAAEEEEAAAAVASAALGADAASRFEAIELSRESLPAEATRGSEVMAAGGPCSLTVPFSSSISTWSHSCSQCTWCVTKMTVDPRSRSKPVMHLVIRCAPTSASTAESTSSRRTIEARA